MQPRRFVPSKSIPTGIIHFTVTLADVSPSKVKMQGDTPQYLPRPCTIHVVTFSKGLRDYHLPTSCTLSQSRVPMGQVKEWGPSGNPRIDPCPKNEQLTLEEGGMMFVAYVRYPVRPGRTRDPINPTFVGVMTLAEYDEAVDALPSRMSRETVDNSAAEIMLAPDEQDAIERIAQARKHDPRFQTPARHGKLSKRMKIAQEQTAPSGTSEEAA